MITIIHGDDIVSSRNYFQEKKREDANSISLNASTLQITDLAQNMQGSGLFGSISTIFIEDLLTRLKKTKETKEIIDFIIKNHKESNIFLWEGKEIKKNDLLLFKDAIVRSFKLPKTIFIFLDSLRPDNLRNTISLFHKTLEEGINIELIFFMLQRQARLLLALSDNNSKYSIEEIMRLAPWQRSKLERQAKLFTQESLKNIYSKLFKIEFAYRTGGLNLSLAQAVDFLLFEM